MFEIFGIPSQALFGQLLLGLINGSFYALLSLGLAVIFGMLNIINFAHGAQYMLGAFAAYLPAAICSGIGYWSALIIAPIVVGIIGIVIERTVPAMALQARPSLRPAADLRPRADHRGHRSRNYFGSSGLPYHDAGVAAGRAEPRLHVPAELSRLGDRALAGGLPRHLVRDRAHAGSAPICAPRPKIRRWCAPSASTCRA